MKRDAIIRALTAFIYCRVSTGMQVEGTSLETQRKRCIEYCERQGWKVVRIFVEEGASAKTTKRPVFQEMLRACRQSRGSIGYVVVYAISRFARSVHDHYTVRGQLEKSGIALRSASEAVDETPMGEFYETVAAGVAQFDNSIRSANTTDGMFACASSGRWVWKSHIGFLNGTASGGGASLIHDPERAPHIRTAFEMLRTGDYSKAQVLAHVTGLGLRRRNGRPLTPQDFAKLVENPIYAGRVVVPSWKIDVKGDFEPIVDEVTFHAVQAFLKGGRPEIRRHHLDNPDFPLRRFVHCAHCDSPFTGSPSKGRNGRYFYYRCRNTKCPGNNDGRSSFRKEVLEAQFVENLRSLAPTGQLGPLFREIVRDVWNRKRVDDIAQKKKIHARIAQLAVEERAATKAAAKGIIPKAQYDDLLGEYRTALALAQLELQRFGSEDIELDRALDLGERLLNDAAGLWNELDAERRPRLQRFIYPDGIPYDGEAFGTAPTCGIFGLAGHARAGKRPSTPERSGVDGGMVTPRGFEPLSPG